MARKFRPRRLQATTTALQVITLVATLGRGGRVQPAHGASPQAQAAPSAEAPSAPPSGDVHRDSPEVTRLGQRLRCPVCQGMPIGDSPAPIAQDMMRQVRRMWADGRSEDDIAAFFTARYGDWVLLDPPWRGAGFWVWVAPPAALVFGVAWALRSLRRRTVRAPRAPVLPPQVAPRAPQVPQAKGVPQAKEAPQAQEVPPAKQAPQAKIDEADLQAIRREVAR